MSGRGKKNHRNRNRHRGGGGGGSAAGPAAQHQSQAARPPPRAGMPLPKSSVAVFQATVSLEEVFMGSEKTIPWERKLSCDACSGQGGTKFIRCTECSGQGKVIGLRRLGPFVQQVVAPCDDCEGKGRKVNPHFVCGICRGSGHTLLPVHLKLRVPLCARDGTEVRLADQGHVEAEKRAGDVIVKLSVAEHPEFARKDKHLSIRHTISITEALCGAKFTIKHLDGSQLSIRSVPGEVIRPGSQLMVSGEGLPAPDGRRGNLYVNFHVEMGIPYEALTPELTELLRTLLPRTERPEAPDQEPVSLVEKDVDLPKFFVRSEETCPDDYDETPDTCTLQ